MQLALNQNVNFQISNDQIEAWKTILIVFLCILKCALLVSI